MADKPRKDLLEKLEIRFEANPGRHPDLSWEKVLARLEAFPTRLPSLLEMERTGGEPDVVGRETETGECLFVDCSAESPAGRRSLCYDRQGREERKAFKPKTSATEMAAKMGLELLSEERYRELQKLGEFDLKTSSWLQTPPDIRRLGGALFGDCRYGRVFIYHNGAPSYYAARGFRGLLRV